MSEFPHHDQDLTQPLTGLRRPGRTRRRWLVAGTAAGLALAVAAGIGWGLAGSGDRSGGGDPLAAGGPATPGATPAPAGLGATPEAGEPAGGVGAGQGGGPPAEPADPADPGTDPGAGGGAEPANQAPLIADPGLSSEGLTLSVAPIVVDPDGDQVSIEIEADGEATAGSGPDRAEFRYPYREFGPEPEATVTVVATDAGGAVTRETFTHQLRVLTTVSLSNVRFTLSRPGDCFETDRTRVLAATVTLGGALRDSVTRRIPLRASRTSTQLLPDRSVELAGDPSQAVIVQADFAGQVDSHSATYRAGKVAFQTLFAGTAGCHGILGYTVSFQRR